MEHTTGTVTVQVLEGATAPAFKNPGDVDFEVKYPADYQGPRLMPEGPVTVSKESAEQFTRMGIGKVVEAAAEPTEAAAPEVKAEPKKKGK